MSFFVSRPALAPTSFEGPFGKIVYRVRVVIDTPRFSKDYKAQRAFYLLNLLDLNQVPDIEVSEGSGAWGSGAGGWGLGSRIVWVGKFLFSISFFLHTFTLVIGMMTFAVE